MNKQFTYNRPKEVNIRKLYIVSEPRRLRDLSFDEIDENSPQDTMWLAKARRLQARRWRKIKHQLV